MGGEGGNYIDLSDRIQLNSPNTARVLAPMIHHSQFWLGFCLGVLCEASLVGGHRWALGL